MYTTVTSTTTKNDELGAAWVNRGSRVASSMRECFSGMLARARPSSTMPVSCRCLALAGLGRGCNTQRWNPSTPTQRDNGAPCPTSRTRNPQRSDRPHPCVGATRAHAHGHTRNTTAIDLHARFHDTGIAHTCMCAHTKCTPTADGHTSTCRNGH